MTGIEIIEWAVKKCAQEKIPPTDSAIVRILRYHLIDIDDVRQRKLETRPAGGEGERK